MKSVRPFAFITTRSFFVLLLLLLSSIATAAAASPVDELCPNPETEDMHSEVDDLHLPNSKTMKVELCPNPETEDMHWEWDDLDPDEQEDLESMGFDSVSWRKFEGMRWYYFYWWDDLDECVQSNLEALGWDEDLWDEARGNWCTYRRPSAELRPFSRLLPQQRQIAMNLGFNESTWFTKEFESKSFLNDNGYDPIVVKVDIPELTSLGGLDALGKRDDIRVRVDVNDAVTEGGNDEFPESLRMPMSKFIRRLKSGEQLYMKYEDDEWETINKIFGDVKMAEELNKAMIGTALQDVAKVGPSYDKNNMRVLEYAMLYVGAENTTTHMHFDLQSFTFLWVASGRKRVRIVPNDQRTAHNISLVNELFYSVWPDPGRTDFLYQDPLPPHAKDVILGPGEGMYIPYHTWHAVENLEPTVAFGLIRDFPQSESRKLCGRPGEEYK